LQAEPYQPGHLTVLTHSPSITWESGRAITDEARRYMGTNGISQRSMAHMMGLKESYFSHLLSGRKPWSLKLLTLFQKVTGCKVTIKGEKKA
jgi:hypothetical protein